MYRITLIFNDGDARLLIEDDVASAIKLVGYCLKSLKGVTGVFIDKGEVND